MTWNYRVVRRKTEAETFYQIHEAYYNKKGKVTAITEDGIALGSDDVAGLIRTLPWYIEALLRPVIDYDTRKEVEPAPSSATRPTGGGL